MEGRARDLFDGGRRSPRRAAGWRHSSVNSICRETAFEALIEGVEMDLDSRRYETFADLYRILHSGRVRRSG